MPRFFVDIEARFAQFQDALDKINKNTGAAAAQMQRAFTGVTRTLGGLGLGVSFAAIGREMLQAAQESEQASNRLTAVLRATGSQFSLTKDKADELAESMQDALGLDDESVRNAQAALLKFGNIHGNVFREGLKLSADLAAFMGTDIPEAAQIVGKSLQSPTEGLTQMERQFGKLTDAQEENIKSLVRQGRSIEAQNAVLELWRQKVGGTADLMNTGLTKATRDVSNAWDDMLEAMGRTSVVGGTVITVMTDMVDLMKDIERLAKGPGPLGAFQQNLKLLEDEIARIELRRPSTRRSPLTDARLNELKAERDAIKATLDAAGSKAVDPFGFDPKSLDVRLGGGTQGSDSEAKRLAKLSEDSAKALRDVDEMLGKIRAGTHGATDEGLIPLLELHEQAAGEAGDRLRELIELERKVREGEVVFDGLHNLGVDARGAAQDWSAWVSEIDRAEKAAADFGFTFNSALEDAILNGEKLDNVVLALARDIGRMFIRRNITEPFGNFVSGLDFSGLFGPEVANSGLDFRASGGPVSAGRPYIVGEEGPEVFIPDASGTILPNGAGGIVVHQTNHFHGDLRAAVRAEVGAMLPSVAEASRRAVADAAARGRR